MWFRQRIYIIRYMYLKRGDRIDRFSGVHFRLQFQTFMIKGVLSTFYKHSRGTLLVDTRSVYYTWLMFRNLCV